MSIGGGTGGIWFSTSVGSAANRTLFINALTKMVTEYNLDGLDFEYVLVHLSSLHAC